MQQIYEISKWKQKYVLTLLYVTTVFIPFLLHVFFYKHKLTNRLAVTLFVWEFMSLLLFVMRILYDVYADTGAAWSVQKII